MGILKINMIPLSITKPIPKLSDPDTDSFGFNRKERASFSLLKRKVHWACLSNLNLTQNRIELVISIFFSNVRMVLMSWFFLSLGNWTTNVPQQYQNNRRNGNNVFMLKAFLVELFLLELVGVFNILFLCTRSTIENVPIGMN